MVGDRDDETGRDRLVIEDLRTAGYLPRPTPPLVLAGVVAFAAGILAWAWLGIWQWALTGAVALLVLGVFANVRKAGT